MEELLKSLQKKCRMECEEAHRQLVCALNGLAGIHIIRGTNPLFLCQFPPSPSFPWESVQIKHHSLCPNTFFFFALLKLFDIWMSQSVRSMSHYLNMWRTYWVSLMMSLLSPAGEFVDATEMYREVLRSSEEHKGKLKTDSLQVYVCLIDVFFFTWWG